MECNQKLVCQQIDWIRLVHGRIEQCSEALSERNHSWFMKIPRCVFWSPFLVKPFKPGEWRFPVLGWWTYDELIPKMMASIRYPLNHQQGPKKNTAHLLFLSQPSKKNQFRTRGGIPTIYEAHFFRAISRENFWPTCLTHVLKVELSPSWIRSHLV